MSSDNNQSSTSRSEIAVLFAVVLGVILGSAIKKVRLGILLGLVIGVMIVLSGWLRATRGTKK